MLKGEDGFQRKEFAKMLEWLAGEPAPDVVHLQEPVACWDTLASCRAPMIGTYHTYSEARLPHGLAAFGGSAIPNAMPYTRYRSQSSTDAGGATCERTDAPADAIRERSDVVAVPAAGVVGEAMVAIVLADAMLEKFGGDSIREMRRNYDGYMEQLASRRAAIERAGTDPDRG